MRKACIIGLGRIASTLEKDPLRPPGCTHAGAYQRCSGVALTAGADVDPTAREAFGADWGLASERLYADYYEMLERERPDLCSVCAYAPQRLEMALAALECGAKGLWLEKALGCSLAEAEGIRAAVERSGAAAVVDYPRRGRAPYRKVKEIIESGVFGSLQTVTCHMTDQLIHTGTHAFDVLRFWCGEALEASGRLEARRLSESASIVDVGGTAEILMSSGATAFVSARRKRFYIFQFDLLFEDARILLGNDIAQVYRPGPSRLYSGFRELFLQPDFDWGRGYGRGMLEDLLHSMTVGAEPLFSVGNAVEALRMALAIFESDRRGGRAIPLSEVPEDLRVESV